MRYCKYELTRVYFLKNVAKIQIRKVSHPPGPIADSLLNTTLYVLYCTLADWLSLTRLLALFVCFVTHIALRYRFDT